jgi:hypothetical protein
VKREDFHCFLPVFCVYWSGGQQTKPWIVAVLAAFARLPVDDILALKKG